MKSKARFTVAIIAIFVVSLFSKNLSAQDKYEVTALNGVAFSEFKGYETWETVAVSVTDDAMNSILANPAMITAYKEGIPGNGKPFPDGCVTVKIAWNKKKNTLSPFNVDVPDTLRSVAFILKDSKRFPETSGWGYAQFMHDPKTKSFTAFGEDKHFGNNCFKCHTAAKATDYIFTAYPPR